MPFGQTIVASMGTGSLIGTGLMVVALPAQMHGRADIEWKDRSYRLLHNRYQEQTDDWTMAGTTLGLAAGLAQGAMKDPKAWRLIAGSSAVGSLAGLTAMMLYRLAVQKESVETAKPSGPISVPA